MPHRLAVRDHMTTDIVTLKPEMDVLQAIAILLKHRISGAPVVDAGGALVGMLTERDCMKVALDAAFHQQSGGTVSDFMATDVITVPDTGTVPSSEEPASPQPTMPQHTAKRTATKESCFIFVSP